MKSELVWFARWVWVFKAKHQLLCVFIYLSVLHFELPDTDG